MKLAQRVDRIISTIEEVIVAGGILVISASVMVNVVCRSARIVLIGAEEIAQFAIVWLTFLGTGLCARKGIHVTMSALIDKIPEKKRKGVVILIYAITGVFCIILAILGAQLTHAVYSRGQVSPALRMPIWYYYIAAAIGFFLTGVHFFRALVKNIREKGVHLGVE
jgi:TRAP-type C4-dicarboxylate transport system permease small subunit